MPPKFGKTQKRALIVDDDPNMASTLNRLLKMNGYNTMVADNAVSAGIYLKKFKPSVMTLDLKMPGMSGIEFVRIIRESPNPAPVKIMVVSAMHEDTLVDAMMAGADAAISKPFEPESLVNAINNLVLEPLSSVYPNSAKIPAAPQAKQA